MPMTIYQPALRAIADHDRAMETRKVETRYGQGAPGTGEAWMVLDEADLLAFDGTMSTIAATMGALGHPGSLDVRRANAVGILAGLQRALDLLAVDPTDPDRLDPDRDAAVCAAEDAMYAGPNAFVHPAGTSQREQPAGEAVLVLHLTDRDLLAGGLVPGRGGVARSDTLGPMLMGRLQAGLVSAGRVTIKPVLDLDAMQAVDAHDPPDRMGEAVRFRDETACSRTGTAPQVGATSTTSSRTSTPTTGDRRIKRARSTWRRCVGATTAPRPTPTSTTSDSPTGPTDGPSPPASRSPPTHPPRDHDPEPRAPTPTPTPVIGRRRRPVALSRPAPRCRSTRRR